MAKLKEKKIEQMKGNQIECAKFEDFMMEEIEEDYEKLLKMKRNNKNRKARSSEFQSYFKSDTNRYGINESGSSEKKRKKAINLDKKFEDSLQKQSTRLEKNIFKT